MKPYEIEDCYWEYEWVYLAQTFGQIGSCKAYLELKFDFSHTSSWILKYGFYKKYFLQNPYFSWSDTFDEVLWNRGL